MKQNVKQKMKKEKRQDKLLQSVKTSKTTLHSSSGNTTNSDEEK